MNPPASLPTDCESGGTDNSHPLRQILGWTLAGFGVGVVSATAYLLLDGQYLWGVPRWADIVFYPGFLAGFQVYKWGLSVAAAKAVGVLTVGLAYALILLLLRFVWGAARNHMTKRQTAMPSQPLFKLNIPLGWNTSKDHLSGRVLASEEPPFGLSWEDLNEDMIFVTSSRCSLAIDLGWYPDYSPEGQFRIEVVDSDNLAATYAKPLRAFATRSVWVAKLKMEDWMEELHANQAGPGAPLTGSPRNNG